MPDTHCLFLDIMLVEPPGPHELHWAILVLGIMPAESPGPHKLHWAILVLDIMPAESPGPQKLHWAILVTGHISSALEVGNMHVGLMQLKMLLNRTSRKIVCYTSD